MTTNVATIKQTNSAVLTNSSVSVAVTATQIVGADSTRLGLLLVNVSDTTMYLGGTLVTVATGFALLANSTVYMDEEEAVVAWFGIHGGSGTKDLRVLAVTT